MQSHSAAAAAVPVLPSLQGNSFDLLALKHLAAQMHADSMHTSADCCHACRVHATAQWALLSSRPIVNSGCQSGTQLLWGIQCLGLNPGIAGGLPPAAPRQPQGAAWCFKLSSHCGMQSAW